MPQRRTTPLLCILANVACLLDAYIDWAREREPGAIPTFVLPSVWYSIMLKFTGRTTNDDYTAFCQFLNLRKSEPPESTEITKAREAIIRTVVDTDEPVDIKEEMIFDISESLSGAPIEIEKIPAVVEKSRSRVLDKRIAIVKKEYDAERHDVSLKQKQDLEIASQKSHAEGLQKGIEGTVEWIAEETVKRNKCIKKCMSVVAVIAVSVIAGIAIKAFIDAKGHLGNLLKMLNENTVLLAIISGSYLLISVAVGVYVRNSDFLSSDITIVTKKINRKRTKK